MEPHKLVCLEVSGTCNAHCPWCERGARIHKMLPPLAPLKPIFISAEKFRLTLTKLLELNIIHPEATINPYNWGEPLLNPEITDIIAIIKSMGFSCQLSTNGSCSIQFTEPDALSHISDIIISMPGFSQASYDRAHGFSFKETIQNITSLVKEFKKNGAKTITIMAHLYKHNQHEMPLMNEFAKTLGVDCRISQAYFNCADFFTSYMNGTMDAKILERAQKDLILFDPKEVLELRPVNYRCPQLDMLILSHTGKVSLCCASRLAEDAHEYELISLDDEEFNTVNGEQTLKYIEDKRKNHPACAECQKLGRDWYLHAGHPPSKVLNTADYESNAGLDMPSALSRSHLTNHLRKKGDFIAATEVAHEAMQHFPQSPEPYTHLALICENKGALDEAIEWARKSLTIDPTSFQKKVMIANLLFKKNYSEEAIEVILKDHGPALKKQEPEEQQTTAGKADKVIKAISVLTAFLDKTPNHFGSKILLANLLRKKGDYEEAIALIMGSMVLLPQDAEPHAQLALLYEGKREFDKAIEWLQKGIALEPHHLGRKKMLVDLLNKRQA